MEHGGESKDKCAGMSKFVNTRETVAFLSIICMVVLSRTAHQLLLRSSQPRIISDIIVGLLFGNLKAIRDLFTESSVQTLSFVMDFIMMLYMFVLGLEMNPYLLLKKPSTDIKIAYAGTLFTFAAAYTAFHFIDMSSNYKSALFTTALSVNISGTSSPVLARLITDLKIGKSDIGRMVIDAGTHSDLITSLTISVACVFVNYTKNEKGVFRTYADATTVLSMAAIQVAFVATASPALMAWVNEENPEGKPMKGSHLVLSLAFMVVACGCSALHGYNPMLSAFVTGLFLPGDGRMAKWVTGKINYVLGLVYPVFFFWMGLQDDLRKFEPGRALTWVRLVVLLVVAIGGKVVGVVIAGAAMGFNWPESVAIGLFMATKGHFHIYLTMVAVRVEFITVSTSIDIIIVCFVTIVYAPAVVARIIHRARKRSPHFRTTLQGLDPSHELQILLCVHDPQNVPATINFMEVSRGEAETDPRIVVYVADMIELIDEIASKIGKSEGVEAMNATDKDVTETREEITARIENYVAGNGKGIALKQIISLGDKNGKADDIGQLAEELMVSLIILPFHKKLRHDGTFDDGHTGIRYVNRKVLKSAHCSVGILVDRGFGKIDTTSSSLHAINIAVIFMGGKDDREALAYAGHVALHRGVKLTVIRFLLDTEAEGVRSRPAHRASNNKEHEEEMRLDDESFADFYERHVAVGDVAYTERHLANSSQTYAVLKSLEGMYALVIVGRGLRVNTSLTVGMNDWQQCPELGPIGDVLSGSNFLVTTSVLIVQQATLKGGLKGLDEDFSVM